MTYPLPQRISAVVFDVGNTLHHIDHAYIAATIEQHGVPATEHQVAVAEYRAKAAVDEHFRASTGGVDAGRHVAYFETLLATLDVPENMFASITGALQAENQRRSLWRVMRPDTPDVLAELRRRGFTLAVVSNADGRVPTDLAAGGIAKHFTTIVDSHLVGVEKPDARIFQIALGACATPASHAIYIGDIYEIDILGARNAGMTGVLLDPLGRYAPVDCLRITTLSRLLELLPGAA